MFIQVTITAVDRKNGFYFPHHNAWCIINTKYITDIKTEGTGSTFEIVNNDNHRYSGIRVTTTSPVADLILAMNMPFNPTTLAVSIYNQNNASKSTYSSTLSTEDIVVMFVDMADTSNTYIWHVQGDKLKKTLVANGLDDIYNSFVVFAGPPTNLVATVTGATEITLNWTVNAIGQAGVAISASEDGGLTFDETFYYYGAAIATCTQIGLTTGNTYFYKARSFKGIAYPGNYTDYSNTVSGIPA
jgi:hypothetical protein